MLREKHVRKEEQDKQGLPAGREDSSGRRAAKQAPRRPFEGARGQPESAAGKWTPTTRGALRRPGIFHDGSQTHGVMARQPKEPMAHCMFRRRGWYRSLVDCSAHQIAMER